MSHNLLLLYLDEHWLTNYFRLHQFGFWTTADGEDQWGSKCGVYKYIIIHTYIYTYDISYIYNTYIRIYIYIWYIYTYETHIYIYIYIHDIYTYNINIYIYDIWYIYIIYIYMIYIYIWYIYMIYIWYIYIYMIWYIYDMIWYDIYDMILYIYNVHNNIIYVYWECGFWMGFPPHQWDKPWDKGQASNTVVFLSQSWQGVPWKLPVKSSARNPQKRDATNRHEFEQRSWGWYTYKSISKASTRKTTW